MHNPAELATERNRQLMPTSSRTRLLNPARRWALRELKIHPGHTVIVVGAPVTWTVTLVRQLVTDTGTVVIVDGDPRRADRAAAQTAERGWRNVHVLIDIADVAELPTGADRAFLDDPGLIADAGAVTRIIAPLGPGGRVAAVCTRGVPDGLSRLGEHVHALRREQFYLGGAMALWGNGPEPWSWEMAGNPLLPALVRTVRAMTLRDYFPELNDLVALTRGWPRIFAHPPTDTQPIAFEQGRLVVLCQGEQALSTVGENAEQIVRLLNRLLDGDLVVTSIDPIEATSAELYLARDLVALKTWLVDYDVGI